MTIQIRIENLDKIKTIHVLEKDFDQDTKQGTISSKREIGPEESLTIHIHLLKEVIIRENIY